MANMPKIPWWSGFPLSAGVGGMSAFAGTLPPWIQAVGFTASAALFIGGVLATAGHFGWRLAFQSKFPERHRQVLQALAEPLAIVQEQALTYAPRDHEKMDGSKRRAEALVSEIPYDAVTTDAVRTFIQACYISIVRHDTADEFRKSREDVAQMAPYLFQCLHAGRGIDRRKIKLPDWRQNGSKAALEQRREAQPQAAAAPPPQQTLDEAWKERTEDRIPFVRIRDLAPGYGLGLALHDPDAANVAYRIEGALRQAAVDGELQVWGRRYRSPPNNEPLVPIPSMHFEEYGFAHGNLHYAQDNKDAHTNTLQMATWGQKGKNGATYYDLQLSFKDTEAVLAKVAKGEA
jgi:hypothetical protein